MINICIVMFAIGLLFGLLYKSSTSTVKKTLQCATTGLEVLNIKLSDKNLSLEIYNKERELEKIEKIQMICERIEQMRVDGRWDRLVAICEEHKRIINEFRSRRNIK